MFHTALRDIFDPNHPIGALIIGVLFLVAAVAGSRVVHAWGRRVAASAQHVVDRTAATFVTQLLKVGCFIFAAIAYAHVVPSLQHIGSAMLASAGLVSLVIGLAAQATLANLISGFSLVLYRPFGIGDVLTLSTPTGKETGTVKEFTLGHTKLLTGDGRWIVVPNSIMAASVLIREK